MKKTITLSIMFILILSLLFGCVNTTSDKLLLSDSVTDSNVSIFEPEIDADNNEFYEQSALPWQKAYAQLLRDYSKKSDRVSFLLHDFDKDGIPELIVAGEDMDGDLIDVFYAFRSDEVLTLEYGNDVEIASFALSARCGVTVAPGDGQGLITYIMGPASLWGTNDRYQRIVVDRGRLIIDAHGERLVDVAVLNKLFDDFGRNADSAEMEAAIEKHTHFYINDNEVSEEELYSVFGIEERLLPSIITETTIQEIIFASY